MVKRKRTRVVESERTGVRVGRAALGLGLAFVAGGAAVVALRLDDAALAVVTGAVVGGLTMAVPVAVGAVIALRMMKREDERRAVRPQAMQSPPQGSQPSIVVVQPGYPQVPQYRQSLWTEPAEREFEIVGE